MNPSTNKVLVGVIYISAAALLILGIMSFFHLPPYEKGAWAAVEAFKDVLLVAVGVKGGAMIPGPEKTDTPPEQ